jgi:hypothetical protein
MGAHCDACGCVRAECECNEREHTVIHGTDIDELDRKGLIRWIKALTDEQLWEMRLEQVVELHQAAMYEGDEAVSALEERLAGWSRAAGRNTSITSIPKAIYKYVADAAYNRRTWYF